MAASNLYVRDLCNNLHKLHITQQQPPTINHIKEIIEDKFLIPIQHQTLWHSLVYLIITAQGLINNNNLNRW